jgi:excisionase family DNA binding protein
MESFQMTQKLLTVKEVSEILDLKPARIYELTRQKKIPYVQIGERQYRYSESALTNWIENGGNQATEYANEN